MNYYNENDKHAAAWLRQLVFDGFLPPGHVDERSIEDVTPNDLMGYTQCHFFAGVGGWPYALALAGFPVDAPIWTGSCPCQPFSKTGKRKGAADKRHLWPAFHWLIRACRPALLVGEQVASPLGRDWWAGVRHDLEIFGYETGAADLCAAGVGAPHKRQRIFWMAHGDSERLEAFGLPIGSQRQKDSEAGRRGEVGGLGLTFGAGLEGLSQHGNGCDGQGRQYQDAQGSTAPASHFSAPAHSDPWRDSEWVYCDDGKYRRVKPGLLLLAHGVSGRAPLIRGYGNAIVPALGAQFVLAGIEAIHEAAALRALDKDAMGSKIFIGR